MLVNVTYVGNVDFIYFFQTSETFYRVISGVFFFKTKPKVNTKTDNLGHWVLKISIPSQLQHCVFLLYGLWALGYHAVISDACQILF